MLQLTGEKMEWQQFGFVHRSRYDAIFVWNTSTIIRQGFVAAVSGYYNIEWGIISWSPRCGTTMAALYSGTIGVELR